MRNNGLNQSIARWNERYSGEDYIYGTRANAWLAACLEQAPDLTRRDSLGSKPKALEFACGEGRNVVFLAERGFEVTGVDVSSVGIEKTRRLAATRGVTVEAICDNALTWRREAHFDLVVVAWFHLPPELKPDIFRAIGASLKPGGTLIAEFFHPDQRTKGFTSGGPPSPEMMFTPEEVRGLLAGFTVQRLTHEERVLHEGPKHDGLASVVSVLARRS